MPKKIPLGVDDFRKLVTQNFLFVDKTLMIKELLEQGVEVSLIIRPRRWGKTLNMSMLHHFFAPEVGGRSTQGLFDDLAIAKESNGAYLKVQGTHPVILITFKGVKEDSFDEFMANIAALMAELYREHQAILENSPKLSSAHQNAYARIINLEANKIELQNALKFLSECLEKHYGKKVIILIDEYDTPLNKAYHQDYFDKAVGFFKNLLGAALKGNSALEKGVMTGILRLSKNNMLSDINNLILYSLLEKRYSQYFGFSESEVRALFEASGVAYDFSQIQAWYNGYRAGPLDAVYNPWSILCCIQNEGLLKPYWIKTGDEDLLKQAFLASSLAAKAQLEILMTGGSIVSVIDEYLSFDQMKEGGPQILWSLLWSLGYLKAIGQPTLVGALSQYALMIPNFEIDCSYREIFQSLIRDLPNPTQYQHFIQALVRGEVETFITELREFLLTSTSYYDLVHESNYQILILSLISTLKESHDIHSNKEFGLGRPDLVLIPRDTNNPLAIILEFKRAPVGKTIEFYEQMAEATLKQIDEKHYDAYLKTLPHIQKILKLSLVFYGKELVYQYSLI